MGAEDGACAARGYVAGLHPTVHRERIGPNQPRGDEPRIPRGKVRALELVGK